MLRSVIVGQAFLSSTDSSNVRSSVSKGCVSEEAEGPGDGSATSEFASEASRFLDFKLDSSLVSSSSISSSLLHLKNNYYSKKYN